MLLGENREVDFHADFSFPFHVFVLFFYYELFQTRRETSCPTLHPHRTTWFLSSAFDLTYLFGPLSLAGVWDRDNRAGGLVPTAPGAHALPHGQFIFQQWPMTLMRTAASLPHVPPLISSSTLGDTCCHSPLLLRSGNWGTKGLNWSTEYHATSERWSTITWIYPSHTLFL